ncbi:MAG: hypothetical protein ACTSRP_09245 [Candidatus Helarchaeota archaeon]
MSKDLLLLLKHDLHKLNLGLSHSSVYNKLSQEARRADGLAAWFSRNFLKQKFVNSNFRISLISGYVNKNIDKIKLIERIKILFSETDPVKLHKKILNSEELNYFCEAREYPFTSLKYHILLVSAFYFFLNKGDFRHLYLSENYNDNDVSEFQVILRLNGIEWAITTKNNKNLSRIFSNFCDTWNRRVKKSILEDGQILNSLLGQIMSWSTALGNIEDYIKNLKEI